MNLTTTHSKLVTGATISPELHAYLGKVIITAQATYDRWPEASGMRKHLWDLAVKANISPEQYEYDQSHAAIECDGGRW